MFDSNMDTSASPCVLLDEEGAAAVLKVRPRTLQWWRCKGRGPRFVKVGALVRYTVEDLESYIRTRAVDPCPPTPAPARG